MVGMLKSIDRPTREAATYALLGLQAQQPKSVLHAFVYSDGEAYE